MVVLLLVVGLAVGALVGWLLARARTQAEAARLQTALEHERAAAEEKLELVRRQEARLEEQFRALSAEALKSNTSSFLELAHLQLAPIKETLQRVGQHAEELERSRRQAYGSLLEQVRSVAEGQEKLRVETGNLRTALRAPHVRGRWGELQLKRVVELAGMVAHCDFVEQSTVADADGRLLRPDVVVRLPGGKNVVVDAKAPLHAYLDAIESDDDERRALHLQAHARQVREHMVKLGQKRYWQQFAPAPEFVVMFLPDESFFRAALEHDPALIEAGVEAGVVPATPTTLIALLRTIAFGWQQETVAESARVVGALGRELYERIGVFARHLGKTGRALESAVNSYNEAVGSLESRVLVTARKLEQHGIGDDLPDVAPLERQPRPLLAPELRDDESVLELPGAAVDAA
jgi:DNA recombination protein RmuC